MAPTSPAAVASTPNQEHWLEHDAANIIARLSKTLSPAHMKALSYFYNPIPCNAVGIADIHGCRSTLDGSPLFYTWPDTLLVNNF